MPTGTIKRLTDRNFGYISPDVYSDDLFFHASALQDADFHELRMGQRVSYELEADPNGRGDRAAHIQLIED